MSDLIKRQFNKANQSYDQYCHIQNKVCAVAVNALLQYKQQFSTIADFACGTGESTLRLIEKFKYDTCYAIDFADKLLAVAQKKLPQTTRIVLADFNEKVFPPASMDLVFCNMGLQWSDNFDKTMALFHSYLQTDGFLVFSMPTAENFPELRKEFKPQLLQQSKIMDLLTLNGFTLLNIETMQHTEVFASYYDALKSLKVVGVNGGSLDESKVRAFNNCDFRDFFNDECSHPTLTYHIGIYICTV